MLSYIRFAHSAAISFGKQYFFTSKVHTRNTGGTIKPRQIFTDKYIIHVHIYNIKNIEILFLSTLYKYGVGGGARRALTLLNGYAGPADT